MSECEYCEGTGYYGDNGPGITGNTEYHGCDMCVIRTGGVDRCYKLCECARCKTIDKCTPRFDFYTIRGDDSGPLYCEACYQIAYHESSP
jgi:hypothetical protein